MTGLSARRVRQLRAAKAAYAPPEPEPAEAQALNTLYQEAASLLEEELLREQNWGLLRQRAEEGASREALAGLLAALAVGFAALRLEREERLRGLLERLLLHGFERGARAMLELWGEEAQRFSLTQPALRLALASRAGGMARLAHASLEAALYTQGAAAVQAGRYEGFRVAHLADLNARLAAVSADNWGRSEAARRSVIGRCLKRWVHGRSKEPRPHHLALNGSTIDLNALFPVASGVAYPHDWARAGVEEWANCSCTVVYLPEEGVQIAPWYGD